jgi:hypothetical protein
LLGKERHRRAFHPRQVVHEIIERRSARVPGFRATRNSCR